MSEPFPKRVLILGAYGLIGAGICRHLAAKGFKVTGLGRNQTTAKRVLPSANWAIKDLRDLQSPDAWSDLLAETDYVVNCAGTLQDGGVDDTEQVHHGAISTLAAACATSGTSIVQISAIGADRNAATNFMRTKAEGDEALRTSGAKHWIFRPGLVLAPNAYGGTALIRMLASIPFIQPIAMADAPVQTVALSDVCTAVEMAITGRLEPNQTWDLVEIKPHSLAEIVTAHRAWLGLAPASWNWTIPTWLLSVTTSAADWLGQLGWRSALRSTAITTLRSGIVGDGRACTDVGHPPLRTLQETLGGMAATAEHRLAARMALMFPLIMAVLVLFWFASGLIGLIRLESAAAVLESAGWPSSLATASVVLWSLVDIALAMAVLFRRYAANALLLMVAVSLFYLLASTLTVPGLWFDPLGPLIKIFPAMLLALVARALLDSR